MTDEEKIRKTACFLKEKLAENPYYSSHESAYRYRIEHSHRVAKIGRTIAEKEGLDVCAMVVACLLHDIAYCEEFQSEKDWLNHGRRSAAIARPFIETLGFDEKTKADILFGIAIHVDDESDFAGERTVFAETIGEADNIDRFGAYRIHENLAACGFLEMSTSERKEYLGKSIAKLENYLSIGFSTETGRKLWEDAIGFYLEYLKRLEHQIRQSEFVNV